MSVVRFRAGDIDLELHGSESFVARQLLLLSPFLGRVDTEALRDLPPAPKPVVEKTNGVTIAPVVEAAPPEPEAEPEATPKDQLLEFYRSIAPTGRDRQADAALLFAYYLQRKEGVSALALGDLIRCCIRAGVDTRNFNRALGVLTRRGFLETVRPGHAYRISDQGAAAVEGRM